MRANSIIKKRPAVTPIRPLETVYQFNLCC